MGMGPHMWEGVKEHDILCEPESYKFKLLRKLVVQLRKYISIASLDEKDNGWKGAGIC